MKSIRSLVRPQMGLLVALSLLLVALSLLLVVPGLLRSVGVARASGSGTWTATGSMTVGRYSSTATLLANGKVLVAGGGSAELYDASSGTWTATGSMTMTLAGPATLLPNGQVLVAGGNNGFGSVASAGLYDASSGTWTATGSMTVARSAPTATLLPNGKVLVAGGDGSSSAELHDASSGTWTATGSMTVARYGGYTPTLLPNGKVLVAGGYSGGSYLASAELYTTDATAPTPTSTTVPSPTPTLSPTVTPSPSPAPGTTIAQDTFRRANQSLWGTASDGQTWGGAANIKANFSISGNAGRVSNTSSTSYSAVLGPTASNAEVYASGSLSTFTSSDFGEVLRWTNGNNWYKAFINGSSLLLQKNVSGVTSILASVPFAATAGISYTLHFRVVGSTLTANVWAASGSEPSGWMVTASDRSLTTGSCGMRFLTQTGTATVTSFQAKSL